MKRGLELLSRLEEFLLGIIFILMVVLYSGTVLVREVSITLSRHLEWIDEATRYLMVWMVFLGLGLALARAKHVSMTSYMERFPERTRWLLRKVIDTVGLVFSLYICWFGADITWLVLKSGQSSPTLGISNAILYAALPVGFALLALRYGLSLFNVIDRWNADDGTPGTGH